MLIRRAALAEIYALARATYPAECCGYLTGLRGAPIATTVVECRNAAPDPETRYEIAGDELYALVRSLDHTDEPARAIFHSHTNGRAYFSDRDARAAATDAGPIYPLDQLVIGVGPGGTVEAALFRWSATARAFVEVAREHGDAGRGDFGDLGA